MHTLQRLSSFTPSTSSLHKLSWVVAQTLFNSTNYTRMLSSKPPDNGDEKWNDAWELSWLPEDLSSKNRAPWETDVNFESADSNVVLPSEADAETKAFVAEMNENWEDRRKGTKTQKQQEQKQQQQQKEGSLYSLENIMRDNRLKKQRIHAGLWMKEIEKQEEARLAGSIVGGEDDIERLLDSCSEYVK